MFEQMFATIKPEYMNLIDVVVKKVLDTPHQVINDELCCWEVTVEIDCWGTTKVQKLHRCSKKEIEDIQPGYFWTE